MGDNTVIPFGYTQVVNSWERSHHEALQRPRGPEEAICLLRSGLLRYAVEYHARYEGCLLGHDRILGHQAWFAMAKGYLALLNGDCGRLDCGTLDGEIRRWAEQFGFSAEEVEAL